MIVTFPPRGLMLTIVKRPFQTWGRAVFRQAFTEHSYREPPYMSIGFTLHLKLWVI